MNIFHLSCKIKSDDLHAVMLSLSGKVYDLEIIALPFTSVSTPQVERPERHKRPPKAARTPRKFAHTGAELIASLVVDGVCTDPEFQDAFEKEGRSRESTTSAIATALSRGLIVRAGKRGGKITYALPEGLRS